MQYSPDGDSAAINSRVQVVYKSSPIPVHLRTQRSDPLKSSYISDSIPPSASLHPIVRSLEINSIIGSASDIDPYFNIGLGFDNQQRSDSQLSTYFQQSIDI